MVAAFILIFAAIAYRLVYAYAGSPADWSNFSPIAAIVLCSGAYLRARFAFLLPLAIIFVSDLILNAHYHVPLLDTRMIPGYLSFGLILLLGLAVSSIHQLKALYVIGCSLLSSLLFYLITNTADWWFDRPEPLSIPLYPKTPSGLFQALVTGHPGFPPTILFFRNTLVSDLIFTLLFLTCWTLAKERESRLLPATSKRPRRKSVPPNPN
jgi:hypothetical protein